MCLPASVDVGSTDAADAAGTHEGSGTIIVMDDEEVMRDTIKNILESHGYTVVCAREGREAVHFFTEETTAHHPIAAVILDLTVPGGMGGKAAVAEIRKKNPEVPIFAASGYADDPVIKNPGGYGFTSSITKPFRGSELIDILERYVTKVT
jgi:CheY-like chemotaxis protein